MNINPQKKTSKMKRVFTKPVMRFKRIAMLLLLIATATLTMSSACSRDDDDANNGITNNNGTVNYSLGNYHPTKKIKSIYFYYYLIGGGDGVDHDNISNGHRIGDRYQKWEWDEDKLAKISFYGDKEVYDDGGEPQNTIIFTYGDNGRIVKAKWEDDNDVGTEMHFVYEPSCFHSEEWRNNSKNTSEYVWFHISGEVRGIDIVKESQWHNEPLYEFVVSNGNIISNRFYEDNYTVTYDDKINPFKDMIFHAGSGSLTSETSFETMNKTISYYHHSRGMFSHESYYLNRNNMTQITFNESDGSQFYIRIEYEYTSDGYPSLMKYYCNSLGNERDDTSEHHYLTVEIEYY